MSEDKDGRESPGEHGQELTCKRGQDISSGRGQETPHACRTSCHTSVIWGIGCPIVEELFPFDPISSPHASL